MTFGFFPAISSKDVSCSYILPTEVAFSDIFFRDGRVHEKDLRGTQIAVSPSILKELEYVLCAIVVIYSRICLF